MRIDTQRHNDQPDSALGGLAAFLTTVLPAGSLSSGGGGDVEAPAARDRRLLYVVTSAFTLAKVIRDQQEASAVVNRVDQARLDKLLTDHDPYKVPTM